MTEKAEYRDFYIKMRDSVQAWFVNKGDRCGRLSKYILLAPDMLHLLYKLSLDKDVSISDKGKLAVAIGYYILPFDLIPEGILGAGGFADDIVLAAFVLNGIINNAEPDIVKKYWAGERDILEFISKILSASGDMLGRRVRDRLIKLIR